MSSIESYETHETPLDIVPVETLLNYISTVPVLETKNGPVEYDLLCAAMKSGQDECVVGKGSNEHSDKPWDWLVLRSDGVNMWQDVVLGAKTIKGEDGDGDTIELMLAPDVAYHGPYTLRFSVDPMYNPTNTDITLTHPKYYGRGVGEKPEEQIDAIYDKPMIEEPKLAEVIPIKSAPSYKEQRDVGHTAVAN